MKNVILKAKIKARKEKKKEYLLFLDQVIMEANSVAKSDSNRETTDQDFLNAIIKVKKISTDTLKEFRKLNIPEDNPEFITRTKDIEFADMFLPKQLNEKELRDILNKKVSDMKKDSWSMKDMGILMGYLKNNYVGQYDTRMASTIVKGIINNA